MGWRPGRRSGNVRPQPAHILCIHSIFSLCATVVVWCGSGHHGSTRRHLPAPQGQQLRRPEAGGSSQHSSSQRGAAAASSVPDDGGRCGFVHAFRPHSHKPRLYNNGLSRMCCRCGHLWHESGHAAGAPQPPAPAAATAIGRCPIRCSHPQLPAAWLNGRPNVAWAPWHYGEQSSVFSPPRHNDDLGTGSI